MPLTWAVAGCKVSITCMDERSRVVYYGSDMTDELGQFDIIVNKYINGKKLKTKLCWVRLVSSPHPTCNILTDFAGGRSGVKLSLPTLVYRDRTEYTLGPFYFTSPLCDEPDTDDSSSNPHQGTHYWSCFWLINNVRVCSSSTFFLNFFMIMYFVTVLHIIYIYDKILDN